VAVASRTRIRSLRHVGVSNHDINPVMPDVRWLFFDLGCTLVDEEAAHECRLQRLVQALADHGRKCLVDEARIALAEAWAEFAPRAIVRVIEKLVDDEDCRRAVLAAARYPKELETPYPAAESVLRSLCACYQLGIIANQSVSSTERLTDWGLMPFVSTCLCSFELGLEKPDPAIFTLALERAGCAPCEALMIGDRLDNDIRPARQLGWKTVRVAQGFARFQSPRDAWDEPDLTANNLAEVTPALIDRFSNIR
jgi:HAD superfamily hydrolase (TIGR01549 family)